jgi:hypothetical protein
LRYTVSTTHGRHARLSFLIFARACSRATRVADGANALTICNAIVDAKVQANGWNPYAIARKIRGSPNCATIITKSCRGGDADDLSSRYRTALSRDLKSFTGQ